MSEARWIRVAGVAGAAFAILILVAGPVLGRSSPGLSASGQTTFDYIRAHRSDIQLSAAAGALATVALVIWLSGLFGALRRTTDGYPGLAIAAVAGGVLAASTSLVSQAIKATTACQITEIGPRNVHVFYTLVKFTNGGVLFGLTVVIGLTAVAALGSSSRATSSPTAAASRRPWRSLRGCRRRSACSSSSATTTRARHGIRSRARSCRATGATLRCSCSATRRPSRPARSRARTDPVSRPCRGCRG